MNACGGKPQGRIIQLWYYAKDTPILTRFSRRGKSFRPFFPPGEGAAPGKRVAQPLFANRAELRDRLRRGGKRFLHLLQVRSEVVRRFEQLIGQTP